MLKNRHVYLKGSMLGPFRLGVTLIAPQESLGAELSNGMYVLRVEASGVKGRSCLMERN